MKVALLSQYATWALDGNPGYCPDARRHPAPWVMNLARALAQYTATEVHVVTQTDEISSPVEITQENIQHHFIPCPRHFRATTFFQFDCRRLRRVLRSIQPDIVHAHGTEDAFGLAGLTSGYPCVITVQGMFFKIAEHVPPPLLSRTTIIRILERWCLHHARHLIAKSDYVADSLEELGVPATIYRVPNAMNPVFFNTTSVPGANRILFIGIIEKRKGLEYLVEAIAALRNKRPTLRLSVIGMAGYGSEGYEKEVHTLVKKLDLENNVEFLGFRRPDAVAQELARSTMLVVPSLEEMFCNVAAEAMASGKPVIATKTGSLPQLVEDGETGILVPIADAAAIATAIETLLDDEGLRNRLAIAGREKAKRLWFPKEVALQTLEVYKRVTASSQPQRLGAD